MFSLSVRFLGGEYVAQALGGGTEWPPHPARLLYALVAAWYEGGEDREELEALRWLEGQEPPAIEAAASAPQEMYEAWVPMNSIPNWNKRDKKRPELPKAERLRTSCFVGDDPVSFVWAAEPRPDHRRLLETLARRCTRLGSAESMAVLSVDRAPAALRGAWRPTASGTLLRVPMMGIVDTLAANKSLMPGRILPCDWRAYRWSTSRDPGRMITLGVVRGSWPVEWAPVLGQEFRRGLISSAVAEGLELLPILNGRDVSGEPLQAPHLQFAPLPHVGAPHASGGILGVAVVVPPHLSEEDRRYAERVLAAWFVRDGSLLLPSGRELRFGPVDGRWGLAEERWARPSHLWQTVLPMELPRHVVKRGGWDREAWDRARAAAELAFEQAGLPIPEEMELSHTPFAVASPHPRRVRGPMRRPLVHARAAFSTAVPGPLLVGSGRYIGLGLMEPLREEA